MLLDTACLVLSCEYFNSLLKNIGRPDDGLDRLSFALNGLPALGTVMVQGAQVGLINSLFCERDRSRTFNLFDHFG